MLGIDFIKEMALCWCAPVNSQCLETNVCYDTRLQKLLTIMACSQATALTCTHTYNLALKIFSTSFQAPDTLLFLKISFFLNYI